MIRTLLVDLPFTSIHRPSLALSLLRGALTAAGHPCDLRYAKLGFAGLIGVDRYKLVAEGLPHELLLGDFIFAEPLSPHADVDLFLDSARRQLRTPARVPGAVWQVLPLLRHQAADFLSELADEIAATDVDLVGFNMTFQVSPAIALAKLLKERAPRVRVVVGGGNCEGEMGLEMHRSFPWIDFVSRGEGERLIVDLVEALDDVPQRRVSDGLTTLANDGGISNIPGLIWRRDAESVANGLRAENVRDLDALPAPDFRDFFEQLEATALGLTPAELSIPFETSRGCWFGAKSHCTFCGLNGPSLEFRSKSAARVLEELCGVAAYGVPNADAVDLILDMKYFDSLLPLIAAERLNLSLFFELKSNISRAHVLKLKSAGFAVVQPGIESLSSTMLGLMRKGVSAYQNVRLLKWLAEAGINAQWNLLYGFPLEQPADYDQIAALVPLLVHLQPPVGGCMRVLLNRFSPLFFDAETLGVRNIRPVEGYAHIFGEWSTHPEQLAYYFDFEPADGPCDFAYMAPLRAAIEQWRELYGTAVFTMLDRDGALHLYDTRPIAVTDEAELVGAERLVFLECDDGASVGGICRRTGLDVDVVAPIVERLVARRWVAALDGRYVSLAVSMNDAVPDTAPRSLWRPIAAARYREVARDFIDQEREATVVPAAWALD